MEDHDQRIKALLREFIDQFMQLFFPDWADLFDWSTIEWLDKELFSDPPVGERRHVDLLAKLKINKAADADQRKLESEEWLALIHVEVESSDSVAPFPKRMFHYFPLLVTTYQLPVLPIALYLRVGKDGIGTDTYTQSFWGFEIVRFNYHYVGLPGLIAKDYMDREQVLAAVLASLMKVPPDERARLKADVLKRIAESSETEQRKYLLANCVQADMKLESKDELEFDKMVAQDSTFLEVAKMATTWFEQGLEQGELSEKRRSVTRAIEKRFGSVPDSVRAKLEIMSADELNELFDRTFDAVQLVDLQAWIQQIEPKPDYQPTHRLKW